ncbi:terminase large subunit domain-containing protein [Rubinisphaera brasiliensis]|uniref:Phage uncharacterized protein n=1 Tax=Rubinisphaera brasiliensis (strain ATCC 49424 / DSM 5305 / JCM 21570 / IAM 15109 / NBRC 103401 / IFAM 1448) TaxID=756272 RepID=F0SNL2_RUBBR|nr:terminase family protein [Rubinisphaera brasiliensis]ADY57846.1 phage uncharacterized protein [Rubinisphaera brasiliensis DSM 5305]
MQFLKPQPGPQEQFLATSADIALYGGAAGGGKTFALLLEALRYVGVRGYRGAVFRRTYPEITNAGGLWDESLKMYSQLDTDASVGNLRHTFPSGAEVQFYACQYLSDLFKFHGSQFLFLGFDELSHFLIQQFFYLISRNRSTAGPRPYIRGTTNPDASSWLVTGPGGWGTGFISWWIDPETGYAIPERSGVIRYFVRVDDLVHWADTPRELIEKFGPEMEPKSVTFIGADVTDNKILLEKDPGYVANLKAQSHIDQERLLRGNWKIQNNEGAYWEHNPEYFDQHLWCESWPDRFEVSAIAVDPSLGLSDKADPSAIVFVGLSGGLFYVDADIQVRTTEQLADDVVNFYLEHRPDVIGCEQNGFQRLMGLQFYEACQRRGIPPISFAELENSVNKEVRIKRLGPPLAEKRFRFRQTTGCQTLFTQLRSFGIKNAHDDGPDCMEMSRRLLFEMAAQSHVYDEGMVL